MNASDILDIADIAVIDQWFLTFFRKSCEGCDVACIFILFAAEARVENDFADRRVIEQGQERMPLEERTSPVAS